MLTALPHSESTPPVYYVLAWGWSHVTGLGEAGLRSLSALAGTLTVPAVYLAGRRLAGRGAALAASALVAVHPLMWWFSQEARSYALATLFGALALWCWSALRDGDGDGGWWWAGWAASGAAAMATHYFAAFVIGAQLLDLLWRSPRRAATLLRAAPVLLVGAALVPLAAAQAGTGHASFIAAQSLGQRLIQVPKQLLVGYASPGQLVTGAVVAVLAATALAGLLRARRPAGGPAALGIAACAVLAPAVLAAAGLDYFNGRNVLVALPALAIALGAGAARLRPRTGVALTAALFGLLLTVTLLVATHERFQREDWRAAARALGAAPGGRIVVASPASADLGLQPYVGGLRPLPAQGAAVEEIDLLAIPARSAGSGSLPPPRPATPPAPPPGFTPAGTILGDRFTVLRFRAATPVAVRPGELAADGLAGGTPGLLLAP